MPFEELPLDGMRKSIATRLQQAKQTIPHFYIVNDIAVGALMTLREELNAAAPRDGNGEPAYRFSLNDFIIKGWAAALRRFPARTPSGPRIASCASRVPTSRSPSRSKAG